MFAVRRSSFAPPSFGRGQNPRGSGPRASLEDPGQARDHDPSQIERGLRWTSNSFLVSRNSKSRSISAPADDDVIRYATSSDGSVPVDRLLGVGRLGRFRKDRCRRPGDDDIYLQLNELGRDLGVALAAGLSPVILDSDGPALDPAEFS
jgi:hypothetical protein